jgi:hypothetical protein
MRKASCLIAFFIFLIFAKGVFAATQVSVSDVPSGINESGEFEASVLLLCSGCTTDSYLRGVFYPSGSSYFGYTKDNSGNWSNVSGSSCTSYFKIFSSDLSKDGTWSGKLVFKPDTESSYYNGSGEYLFKVGRYTPSCGSPTWSLESTISIVGPTKTPTPLPTSTPTNTQTPTKTPTLTKSPTPSPVPSANPTGSSFTEDVLGENTGSDSSLLTSEPTRILSIKQQNPNTKVVIILVIGSVFLIVCVILWILIREKKIFKKNEE